MKIQSLSVFICILLIAVVVPLNMVSADQDGDYTYVVNNGEAIITAYTGTGGNITIPSALGGYPTVAIGDSAFCDCTSLISVNIPNSVTTIGQHAFFICTSLTSVTIGSNVTSIGDWAFQACYYLTTVTIPNSVITIGSSAFQTCAHLTSVTIGSGVASIGDSAFCDCFSLTSVTIPNSVISIWGGAFYSCYSLTSVTIGSSVYAIRQALFAGCTSLTSITFLGLVAPTIVDASWIDGLPDDVRGHAYAASNFPHPGEVWNGLTMGTFIADVYVDDNAPPEWYNSTHVHTIQEGIDATSDGNTIFVFNGTYNEQATIGKPITLVGEDKNSTFIEGSGTGTCFNIQSDNVNIAGFTIEHYEYGIYSIVGTSNSVFTNLTIQHITWGAGIAIDHCNNIIISHCTLLYGEGDIKPDGIGMNCFNSSIVDNTFSEGWYYGVSIDGTNNVVTGNTFSNNIATGLNIGSRPVTHNNQIYYNNFISNSPNAYDSGYNNNWDNGLEGNYWSDYTGSDANGDGIGDTPYNIPGGSGQDLYPCIYPNGWIPPSYVWVDDNFTSSIPGWGYDHFNRIQDGINAVAENGTVYVYDGIYYEKVTIDKNYLSLIGENKNSTIIDSGSFPNWPVIAVWGSYITISGFTLRNGALGIDLNSGTGYNTISDNIITSCGGFPWYWALRFMGNRLGHEKLFNNTLIGNYANIGNYGGALTDFFISMDTTNTVNGKPVYYLVNQSNLIIDPLTYPEIGYLAIIHSENITVKNLGPIDGNRENLLMAFTNNSNIENVDFSNWGYAGIIIHASNNISIKNSMFSNHLHGMMIDFSNDILIMNNSIINNYWSGVGIDGNHNLVIANNINNYQWNIFLSGSNTLIYHNNFLGGGSPYIANAINCSWNDGYPSGGNYWYDYSEVDNNNGPNQTIPGSDGIGDTPYNISNSDNQDLYPLMHPWGENPPVINFTFTINALTVVYNASASYDRDGTIISYMWNFGDGTNQTGTTVNHTFTHYGSYNTTLIITDNIGLQSNISKIILLIDCIPPSIQDNTPSVGYTSDVFTFNATITDNDYVSIATIEYWYGAGTHINVNMTNVADDYWTKTITIANTLDALHYIISASDTSNNWNSTGIKNVTIFDNDKPVISNVQAAPQQQKLNGFVNISATVTDNIEVNQVYLFITYSNGLTSITSTRSNVENFSITQNKTGDTYYCNKTYRQLGTYTYHLWANDTSGNSIRSADYIFTIIDQPPYIPYDPDPFNETTDVFIHINITWSGEDPDPGDTVTYDVYFGHTSSPHKIASNITQALFDPGTLAFNATYYWRIVAWDNHGMNAVGPLWQFTTRPNNPPGAPLINGPSSGKAGVSYDYTFVAVDTESDDIFYQINWGDGTNTSWLGPFASDYIITENHTWEKKGTYTIEARAKDIYGAIGPWGTLIVTMPLDQLQQSTQLLEITQLRLMKNSVMK